MSSIRVVFAAVLALGLAVLSAPTTATASAIKVHPGESIQTAVDNANPGDTVIVYPGDYTEMHGGTAAVRITKSLKLIAKSKLKKDPPVKVRILPGPNNQHGILVEPENGTDPDIDKIMIKGFTVEGFSNNGIWLRHTHNFKIIGNESIDNLENGIWPTLSAKGLVKKNLSYGSEDSALWVEAAEDVRIIKNELHNAPTGLEITVSKNILAKKNDIHDNTVGVGLYHPNAASLDPLGGDGYWRIEKNHIYNNNAENTAPGGLSSGLPPGAGILVLGVDNITVKNNTIENNGFLGVAVLDWCIATALAGPEFSCANNPLIEGTEANPDYVEVTKNTFVNNGGSPPSGFENFAADQVYLAFPAAVGSCFGDNVPANASYIPLTGIPACD